MCEMAKPQMDRPAFYEILACGEISAGWKDWFPGFTLSLESKAGNVFYRLAGAVPDQAGLLGHLARLHNLGCTLLEVKWGGQVTEEA